MNWPYSTNLRLEVYVPTLLLVATFILGVHYALLQDGIIYSTHSIIYSTPSSRILRLVILFTAAAVFRHIGRGFLEERMEIAREFGAIYNLTVVMLLLLVQTMHILGFICTLIGISIGLYVLLFSNRESRAGREAGAKYVILSILSLAMISGGFALFQHLYHTGDMVQMGFAIVNGVTVPFTVSAIAIALFITGMSFKLAVFPGLQWAPEVYDGSPAPVTAFLLIPVKVAIGGAFIQMVATTNLTTI